jgi:tRNA U55 pseudouridine synthase TruB
MSALKRTLVDKFKIEDSYTFEEIENGNFKIWSMEDVFNELPKIELNARKKALFLNGVMLTLEETDGLYNIYSNGEYIGLGIIKNNLLKRDIVE